MILFTLTLCSSSLALAETEVSLESHTGAATISGNELAAPHTIMPAVSLSMLVRRGQFALLFQSSLIAGVRSGDNLAYWSLGPGLRFYQPLASKVRNEILLRLEAFTGVGFGRTYRTEHAGITTGRGYSAETSAGLVVGLVPIDGPVVVEFQVSGASRFMSISHSSTQSATRGTAFVLNAGFTVGVTF